MRGIRPVAIALCGGSLAAGCGSPSSSGSDVSAPTISNLTVAPGVNRTLVFQMSATDLERDLAGGRCLLVAVGFTGTPVLTVTPPPPPSLTAPLTVTCTLSVPSGQTGRSIRGSIAIADAAGHVSNQLTFTATLPEQPRASS